MGKYSRTEALAQFGETYVKADSGLNCVYCGLSAQVGDHVPPLAYVAKMPSSERLLWPACWICNGTLGAYPRVCLVERAEYLIGKLRADWAFAQVGRKTKWSSVALSSKGLLVRARLQHGDLGDLCRCSRCKS